MVRSNAVRAVAVEQQRRGPVARRRAQLEEGNRHTDAIRGLGIGYQRVVATCFKTGAGCSHSCSTLAVAGSWAFSRAVAALWQIGGWLVGTAISGLDPIMRALPELEMGAAQVCAKLGSHLIRKLRVDHTMRIFRTKT